MRDVDLMSSVRLDSTRLGDNEYIFDKIRYNVFHVGDSSLWYSTQMNIDERDLLKFLL